MKTYLFRIKCDLLEMVGGASFPDLVSACDRCAQTDDRRAAREAARDE